MLIVWKPDKIDFRRAHFFKEQLPKKMPNFRGLFINFSISYPFFKRVINIP